MDESIRAQLINTSRDVFQDAAPVSIDLRAASAGKSLL
jgi:hypothetical protein